jgi:two-component system, OmpR family, response regulator ChvI
MHDVHDVVLVDDDALYREALSADLADRGFAVAGFADAPSFLAALGNGIAPQVALLDWALPEMSGFELMGALRERGIGLPVVFLTGYSFVERELRALGNGAVDFVDKARGTEVLARRLRVIIEAQRVLVPGAGATLEAERHGELSLQAATARALWRQLDVGLTITEYKLVMLLVAHKGQPQTYRALYDAAHYAGFVAGSGEHGHHTNVRSLVKRLRRKFLAIDADFAEIENVAQVGYLWRETA